MSQSRDPRVDPKPGDVVGDRHVVEVLPNSGMVVYRIRLKRKLSSLHYCGPTVWIDWSKDKEIKRNAGV